MAWSFTPDKPVYIQVADKIRFFIISGTYPPGSQIPTVRQLAVDSAVNPNTVQRAFQTLEQEGILTTRGTMGRFVTDDTEMILSKRHEYAESIVGDFLKNISRLGFNDEEIINFVKEALK